MEYLARTKGQSISISSTHIVFLTEMQKGKPSNTDLPSWKTISQQFQESDIYGVIAELTSSGHRKRLGQMTLPFRY